MASVVATLFIPGGKTLNQQELDTICGILNITAPLPVGPACTYFLLLSTNSPLPTSCGDTGHPLMALVGKKSPTSTA